MKKLLLIVATHGNEKIGLEVVEKLKEMEGDFDVLIANPRALRKNQRFIDSDLNRSYPGNRYSMRYEERKACDNFRIAKKYQYIIDLHEASEGRDDFVIIPRDFCGKKFPLKWINLEKVLLWPFPQGPISQFLENSIELEFGVKNRKRSDLVKKATEVIESFILATKSKKTPNEIKKKYFYVYGEEFSNNIKKIDNYLDFRKVSRDGEEFYPLLVGQYLKQGIAFYKMKSIDDEL